MPRRRRFPKTSRSTFSDTDLIAGPLFFFAASEDEADARIAAMEKWYAVDGAAWEREQAADRPGKRSCAWWAFVAGEENPSALGDEEKLRRIAAGGHLSPDEVRAIFATAEHFQEQYLNFRDPSGRPFYAEHASERPIHGVDPRLWPARVLRETLGATVNDNRGVENDLTEGMPP